MQKNTELKSKVFIKRINGWASVEKIQEDVLSLWQGMGTSDFVKKNEFLGIKLTFGEEGNTGYIKPAWLLKFIEGLKAVTDNSFIVETNTLYREKRGNAVGHLYVAKLHGYDMDTFGIPIIIADGLFGRDSQTVPIRGHHFDNVKLARAICETDAMVCLSHATGHIQSGFAGAIKNLGMGCASRSGKLLQHSKTLPEVTVEKCIGCGLCLAVCPANAIGLNNKKAILVKERCIGCGECTIVCRSSAIDIKYDENNVKFQEKMVEYALGVKKALKSRWTFINFLCNITKNCDCMSKGEDRLVADIGVIGGIDPVAVDKASLDLIGIDAFKNIFPEIDPLLQIEYAEKLKLGSGAYELVEL